MTKKTTRPSKQDTHDNNSNLDSRYGSIGISAVVAALQFKQDAKSTASAPATTPDEEKRRDMAA